MSTGQELSHCPFLETEKEGGDLHRLFPLTLHFPLDRMHVLSSSGQFKTFAILSDPSSELGKRPITTEVQEDLREYSRSPITHYQVVWKT